MTLRQKRDLRNGLLFISPWLFGMAIFLLYPIGASLYYSFCDYSVLLRPIWIGFGNYLDLFTDEVFWKSLWNTVYFVLIALPLQLLLALGIAWLLSGDRRGVSIYRTAFFIPSLIPVVAMAILWTLVFNGDHGIMNQVLRAVGLPAPNWFTEPVWAKPAIIIVALVSGIGPAMVIYLAGLRNVPEQFYEAAEIDGAGALRKLWHVSIPLISPVILFNVIYGIINAFQFFTLPYVLTSMRSGQYVLPGGPARATTFYTMNLYDQAFRHLNMGYACAMAWILFVIILALTLVVFRYSVKRVYYAVE